jgi:hypothetical protein
MRASCVCYIHTHTCTTCTSSARPAHIMCVLHDHIRTQRAQVLCVVCTSCVCYTYIHAHNVHQPCARRAHHVCATHTHTYVQNAHNQMTHILCVLHTHIRVQRAQAVRVMRKSCGCYMNIHVHSVPKYWASCAPHVYNTHTHTCTACTRNVRQVHISTSCVCYTHTHTCKTRTINVHNAHNICVIHIQLRA